MQVKYLQVKHATLELEELVASTQRVKAQDSDVDVDGSAPNGDEAS